MTEGARSGLGPSELPARGDEGISDGTCFDDDAVDSAISTRSSIIIKISISGRCSKLSTIGNTNIAKESGNNVNDDSYNFEFEKIKGKRKV